MRIGQGQRRRDDDGFAGVDAHSIQVLHRAYDDRVVAAVAQHLELEFLPAENRLLNQHLRRRRKRQPAAGDDLEFFGREGDAAASFPERVGGADDRRISQLLGERHRLWQVLRHTALWDRLTQLDHAQAEFLAVLGHLDGFE